MVVIDVLPIPGPTLLSVSPKPALIGGAVGLVVLAGAGLRRLAFVQRLRGPKAKERSEP